MSNITIKVINNNVYGVNSYIIISGNNAIIIDTPEVAKSNSNLEDYKKALNGADVKLIVYTHGHFDHISGTDNFRNIFTNAKQMIHEDDLIAFTDTRYNASGLFGSGATYTKADSTFKHGDNIKLGDNSFRVIHTPGHTNGCCCFYNEDNKMLITGDTLFTYGVGRTDLESGSESKLIDSITNRLFTLPDDTLIYPGHSEYSSLLGERKKMGLM